MLFKKVIEKYYTDASSDASSDVSPKVSANVSPNGCPSNAQVNLYPGQGLTQTYIGGFDNSLIQKFTFDMLEEINEIEEERRKKEMKDREELSQLRYLELQRILYNLQFNITTPIDRETRNQLKETILNMTTDDLKNKYKADLHSFKIKEKENEVTHTPAGVCQNKAVTQNKNIRNEDLRTPAGVCQNELADTKNEDVHTPAGVCQNKAVTQNKNIRNEDVHTPAGVCQNELADTKNEDVHTPAGVCQNEDKDIDSILPEILDTQQSKYFELLETIYEEAGNIEHNIKKCIHVIEPSVNLNVKDVSNKKKQFISIDNVIYKSLKEASAKLDINKATILWRLKSANEKFNNYTYVDVNTNVNVNVNEKFNNYTHIVVNDASDEDINKSPPAKLLAQVA
jgi:hypothetical protein